MLSLTALQKYTVIRPFTDFDGIIHPIGETWIFKGTNFLPYDDGLTLHVIQNEKDTIYRLRWIKEDQGDIIDHFTDYVTRVDE